MLAPPGSTTPTGLALTWVVSPGAVDAATRRQLLACWLEVSNAGGAVGFPRLPVTADDVAPVLDDLLRGLDPVTARLLLARRDGDLAGWLVLAGSAWPPTGHWAAVRRVQTALPHRGTGVGRALMTEVARAARDDLGLDQLHLSVRGGAGLEGFYRALGWVETGRWPRALAISDDDRRDEVLMVLTLR